MSTYTDASLIVTPNAYKAGKLYSLKPTDGTGDLNVVRATSATRVNEQGLIEIPRTNLATYSEQFDNATWTKTRTIVVSNATIAPDGNLTADKLIDDTTASATHQNRISLVVSSGTYTMSIFAKKGEYNFIRLWEDVQTGKQAFFDLNNGVATNVDMNSVSIVDFGNGWYRCIATVDMPSAGGFGFRIILTPNGTTTIYNGTGTNGVFIWGAQLEVGNVATEYIPTTSVIRTRFAGITQDGGSASNIPRIDYTNGSCPSILVEPQRTNLLLRSQEFDNASWGKTNSLVISNQIISPDGNTTADKINETAVSGYHLVTSNSSTAGTYTSSVFAKKGERNFVMLWNDGTNSGRFFDLENGILGGTLGAVPLDSKIEDYGNGWYRCIITNNNATRLSIYTAISSTSAFYLGEVGKGIYIWGAQLEAGATATSYIPTVASTVTRNADVISKSGISSLIGQTEGTIFIDVNIKNYASDKRIIGIEANGIVWTQNNILIQASANKSIIMQFVSNNIYSVIFTATNQDVGRKKIIVSYNGTQYKFFINGVLIGTNNNTTPIMDKIQIGGLPAGGPASVLDDSINSVLFLKNQLTDAECIALTTL